jgi:hypothetical protein
MICRFVEEPGSVSRPYKANDEVNIGGGPQASWITIDLLQWPEWASDLTGAEFIIDDVECELVRTHQSEMPGQCVPKQ